MVPIVLIYDKLLSEFIIVMLLAMVTTGVLFLVIAMSVGVFIICIVMCVTIVVLFLAIVVGM